MRVYASQKLYKKRQALVEHPFGTIKRQWGFDYIMTKKGIQAASADLGLIAIAYNLRRLFNMKLDLKGLFIWLNEHITLLIMAFLSPYTNLMRKFKVYNNSLVSIGF